MSTSQQFIVHLSDFSHAPIDIHSHFNHGSPFDCPENERHLRGYAFLESAYQAAGVAQVGMSTYASVMHTECIVQENQYLHTLVQEKDWIYQWVVIDPRQPETYKQAEQMLGHPKVLGIKLQPDSHRYDILEYGDALFSFSNSHKAVVLIHPQDIPSMVPIIDKYPQMKLIIAHLGSTDHVDAIVNARHGNIYADTSGAASGLNNIVEYAVQRAGSKKILFGTDTYSFAFQFGRIALSGLPQEDKENILWKNATELFDNIF